MGTVAVLFADGFEEIEAITQVDLLRRAGLDVVAVGVTAKEVIGGHDIRVDTDMTVDELPADLDAIVIPGGDTGARNIAASAEAMELITRHMSAGRLVAAICAAPAVVLGSAGLLDAKRFTCYPGYENQVTGAHFSEDRVVVDGALITSRGPGTAAEFALAVIAKLVDEATARDLRKKTIQPAAE